MEYRSPWRAVPFVLILALPIGGMWAEGMVSGWTALGLVALTALVGVWLARTRPENDEMTEDDKRDFRFYMDSIDD